MKPYGILYLAGGLVGGIAMAIFATTAVDIRGGRVLERWQVERGLKLPVLAEFKG